MNSALAVAQAYQSFILRPVADVAADLESYSQLLTKWQRVQNLVSRETLADVWSRHMADSVQTLSLVTPEDRLFLDFGSGGGFPALPMAIGLKGGRAKFTLVEPTSRKVSFLRTVARELDLAVDVRNCRGEDIDPRETQADVITSRALANLSALCTMSLPFFGTGTRALFHKGREHVEELREAHGHFSFDVLITQSDTDRDGVLLELRNLSLKNK